MKPVHFVYFLLFKYSVITAQIPETKKLNLEKEYVKFEEVSFNKGKLRLGMNWKEISKNFKFFVKNTRICEEDTCWFADAYYTNTNYKTNIWGGGICEIFDKSLKFDYYPKMLVGAEINSIEEYFPITYRNSFLEFLRKNPKAKTYLFVLNVEHRKGAFPNEMGYLTMVIKIDLISKRILSFKFFDQSQ